MIRLGMQIRCRGYFSLMVLAFLLMSGCSVQIAADQLAQVDVAALAQALDETEAGSGALIDMSLIPDPQYAPEEVVQIQLQALQHNNETDDGIELVFRFASPANKHITGPLRRFKRLVKTPEYAPMLNHYGAAREPVQIIGNDAYQRVTLLDSTGNEIVYIFLLSKQTGKVCRGCWMTDGVFLTSFKPAQAL